jgi:lysozyme
MLRVLDISVFKSDIDLSAVSFDAVIEKATGGNGYVNPDCDAKIEVAKSLGKKWGFFHYYGDGFNDNDPISEADWFVNNCQGYFHQGYPILDWERGGNAQVNDPNAALQWLQHVEQLTGVKCGIYMSLSLITSLDWSAVIAGGYSLWCAAYVDNNNPVPNWQMDFNRDPNPHWDGTVNDVMWQFTSTGQLDGYGGNLDCSFFFGTAASWDAYANTATPIETTTTTSTVLVQPPAETTTTTTEVPAPPAPEPTTTTTTTTEVVVSPPDTATTTSTANSTTTTSTSQEVIRPLTLGERIVADFMEIINWFRGVRK